jgi:5'-nucleotidase
MAVVGLTTAPAHAAEVKISLLNINDFHGRIEKDRTVQFANTVESERAKNEANTLFLSAGDNIGATLFASASQQDNPTIDVLNALNLRGSAVGNHEFDAGFADLKGRVQDRAAFDYLGANVYNKGTTTPALDEYAIYTVGGVDVGVIGVVTQETPTLVSPSGVSSLDFGDPVAAVNRVAAQLSDTNLANGEADVIVAEYHEGAQSGTTLAESVAADATFARIVNDTSGAVDVIFNGHTHRPYAFSANKPGGGTRPVVQSAAYGATIGRVDLTFDDVTGQVTAHTQSNVTRGTDLATTDPQVAQVKAIVDAALAAAAVVGNQPVGQITADITRADKDPSTPTITGEDDRTAESALGGLVGNALRDGVPAEFAQPDIGITNPGGIRDDLLFKGNTTDNPANTDGVITFAEANNVLPFANNISLVTLSGASLAKVFEQQFVAARGTLHLGVSDNVKTTIDPTRPEGSKITSLRIDGKLVDPAAKYTVSTPSFLAGGGDQFTAFKDGTNKDTGFLDRDLWINYLKANKPLTPDFAREQVYVQGLPADTVRAGDLLELNFDQLDMNSVGAPLNTRLDLVKVKKDGSTQVFGTTAVTGGKARAKFTVRGGKELRIVAQPSGTTLARSVVVTTPTLAHKVFPKKARLIEAKETRVRIKVKVKSAVDLAAKGRVTIRVAGRKYNAKVKDGVAKVKLRTFAKPGKYRVRVSFKANDIFNGVAEKFTLRVRR